MFRKKDIFLLTFVDIFKFLCLRRTAQNGSFFVTPVSLILKSISINFKQTFLAAINKRKTAGKPSFTKIQMEHLNFPKSDIKLILSHQLVWIVIWNISIWRTLFLPATIFSQETLSNIEYLDPTALSVTLFLQDIYHWLLLIYIKIITFSFTFGMCCPRLS